MSPERRTTSERKRPAVPRQRPTGDPVGDGEWARRLSECSPVGMAVLDARGRVVYANARAVQLLELERGAAADGSYDLGHLTITDPAGNRTADTERVTRRVLESGVAVHDLRRVVDFPDGRSLMLSVSAAPVGAAGLAEHVVWVIEDVSERAQENERRWAADHRRAAILESVSDAFVALDREWRYTYVNKKAGELFGRRPEDLVGRHIWTEFPEGVGQPFYHAYHRAVAEGAPVLLEEYYPPWDRWYENRIYPSDEGLAIYFSDVTGRKKSEQLLAGQIRVLEMIGSGRPLPETLDAIARLVDEQSPETMASILLLDEDGVHVRHGAAPRLPEAYTRAVDGQPIGERAGSCGTAAYRGEPVIVADIATDPLWEDYRDLALAHGLRACWSTPIFDTEKRVLGTLAIYATQPGGPAEGALRLVQMATHVAGIGITRSRRSAALAESEARYRELAARLEQRVAERTAELESRTREMEAFTYSVSHDLKAPLRGLDGYSRLLLEDHAGGLDDEARTFLGNIRTATVQMAQLIDDLLAYSRMERRPFESAPLEVRNAVEAMVAERRAEIDARGVRVRIELPRATVTADREGLTVALRNLFDNALKFTRDVPGAEIEIGGRATGPTCTIWVRDNGPGFDMRFHDRIFELFQRLHRSEDHPGTGIGLAIVRRAMERMGGRAFASSEPGAGATFYLELPKCT